MLYPTITNAYRATTTHNNINRIHTFTHIYSQHRAKSTRHAFSPIEFFVRRTASCSKEAYR